MASFQAKEWLRAAYSDLRSKDAEEFYNIAQSIFNQACRRLNTKLEDITTI